MTTHRQVWTAIQEGDLTRAVLLARDLMLPGMLGNVSDLPEDWPIRAAYAVASTRGDQNLRGFADLAHALAMPNNKTRALHTMMQMKESIRLRDWYTAQRMCARIRSAMGSASLSPRIVFRFLVEEPEAMMGDTDRINRYFDDLSRMVAPP